MSFVFITYCKLTSGMKKSNIHIGVWKQLWRFASDELKKVWKWTKSYYFNWYNNMLGIYIFVLLHQEKLLLNCRFCNGPNLNCIRKQLVKLYYRVEGNSLSLVFLVINDWSVSVIILFYTLCKLKFCQILLILHIWINFSLSYSHWLNSAIFW